MSKVLAWKERRVRFEAWANGLQQRDGCVQMREATTGRVVGTLPRVWAVADRAAVACDRAEQIRKAAPKPELAFYRKYTEALLVRYVRLAMGSGRVPSLLGREMFRGNVTRYRVQSFEDVVIFCCDVEKCLSELSVDEMQLIKRIALQEYTQAEAAAMVGMSLRTCVRRYEAAIDHLTAVLLRVRLMEPLLACQ